MRVRNDKTTEVFFIDGIPRGFCFKIAQFGIADERKNPLLHFAPAGATGGLEEKFIDGGKTP
ncbi:MAG: hypothetical protein HY579_13500 [Nitrospinae bacterium]|nr:hypothetical protein [Nitrospinota bacterium]